MGALSDIVNMGHWGRMRMWLLAIAVAIVGTTWLSYAGLVDLTQVGAAAAGAAVAVAGCWAGWSSASA